MLPAKYTRKVIYMRLMYTLYTNGKVRAYFDKMPALYGEGNTMQEALADLNEKLLAILQAIADIQNR